MNADDGSFCLRFLSDASGAHALELTWLRDRTAPYNLGDNEFHLAVRCADKKKAYELHKGMGCICYENKEMGLYFIADPDGYWIEILGPKNNMSSVKTLLKRHSVREFLSDPVNDILVCGDLSREKYKGFWVQDCSAAVENMLIAIQSYGLGGVWLGVYPDENRAADLRTLFEIDDSSTVPFALVPIGFAKNRRFQTTERYDASRVYRNTMKTKDT